MYRKSVLFFAVTALTCISFAQKKVLDASVYDGWKSIRGIALSDNGKWVAYTIAPQDGDAVVEVKATDGSKSFTIERGGNTNFSSDGRFFDL